MTDEPSAPTVQCTLSRDDQVARLDGAVSTLTEHFLRAVEKEDGYTLHFDGTDETLRALFTFILNERECCSFATYTLATGPPYDRIELTITGPEGTKKTFEGGLIPHLLGDEGVSNAASGGTRPEIRRRYADIATGTISICCGGDGTDVDRHRLMGYDLHDLDRVADPAQLGLGCGNPTEIAELERGEVVVDLGAGAGFDCFLAAEEVGDSGRVIGVDMTPEMVELAREHNDSPNVEFRLGEIEHLPIANGSADVVMSNCVVNLAPNERRVFEEAFRILEPSGRIAISDIVSTGASSTSRNENGAAGPSCLQDCASIPELESVLDAVGFEAIEIDPIPSSDALLETWEQFDRSADIASVTIEARKPTD